MENLGKNCRYNKLNNYLKEKFGERTLKICVNGFFTCPNRDGTKSYDGCIFCSEKGSGEHLKEVSIKKQVQEALDYKKNKANKFIVYFQNYSNTYDSISSLKAKYDEALVSDKIVGLSIATRPDCINENICKALKSYTNKYHVSVEIGLQTADEMIGDFINRKYSNLDFINATKLLNKYNIDVIAHIMVGLPYETKDSIDKTINLINSLEIQGIKIHSTYVVKNTKLAKLYEENKYTPISLEYYIKTTSYILTHIKSDIVIHRISGDAPKDILLAPDWNLHKKWIMNGLNKYLEDNNLYQGMYYKD